MQELNRGEILAEPALDDDAFARRMGLVKASMYRFMMNRHSGLFEPLLRRRLAEQHPDGSARTHHVFDALDEICCQHRVLAGRYPVAVYADEAPDLTLEERATLRRWTEVRQSTFQVLCRQGRRFDVRDLLTGQELVLRMWRGGVRLHIAEEGTRLIMKVVPVRSFFMHIGALGVIVTH
jgi:hypothetical protein